MRSSRFLLATLKETPTDAEIVSHQLMLRAGLIRRVAAGIYNWLPLGLKVLRKVENIVREEMDNAGAQELLMPAVQPAELWRESGRWNAYGPELLRFNDRHQREFCFGPTHEEVITTLVKNEIRSYRQLPANFYQIQTKFRDEIRPRFGVMRGREFLMKDAYSFDVNEEGLQTTYKNMYTTYSRIFERLGLDTRAVKADTGTIGGDNSHEFHVLADSGEDEIAICRQCSFAANVEMIPAPKVEVQRPSPTATMQTVDTPNMHTIEELSKGLKIDASQTVKTLIVQGTDGLVALVVRGDHELNSIKAEKLAEVQAPFTFASTEEIGKSLRCDPGSIGPVGIDLPVIVDADAGVLVDFVCGANQNDKHLTGVNWGRDCPEPKVCDLRKVIEGDPCPESNDSLRIRRGIEVGHIFQLGTKYSEALKATFLDENGESVVMSMGCYGIGVSRIVASAIEQHHDDAGIIWPDPIAPFEICIVPIGLYKSDSVKNACDSLYLQLQQAGFDVLLDDRNERPGVMFADMELIGIPHRLVVGERSLKQGKIEYVSRRTGERQDIPQESLIETLGSLKYPNP